MEWSMILEYINPELIGVVIASWIIGYALKRTPLIPDWTIVYLVTLVAIVFACMLLGFTVQSVIQGILCGAVAVYGNQLVKQGKKGVEEV
ncbi:phage holin family protein [Mycolicibacterium fortuitum]|uniref:phage holin family protein n=1 Tax=Paenibacillus sp. FSL W8-1287 TaxID=2954653 RepID=UPI001CE0BE63|nr:phage holin family protein [Mycolicibacterium fortuitum]